MWRWESYWCAPKALTAKLIYLYPPISIQVNCRFLCEEGVVKERRGKEVTIYRKQIIIEHVCLIISAVCHRHRYAISKFIIMNWRPTTWLGWMEKRRRTFWATTSKRIIDWDWQVTANITNHLTFPADFDDVWKYLGYWWLLWERMSLSSFVVGRPKRDVRDYVKRVWQQLTFSEKWNLHSGPTH